MQTYTYISTVHKQTAYIPTQHIAHIYTNILRIHPATLATLDMSQASS